MNPTHLEVLFSPAEFALLPQRDLSETTCVVFDVLRATSSMVTALAHGAEAVIPVGEISEAVALKSQRPEVLLAGEREGFRIMAALTGSIDFDLGNSPREFTSERIKGKTIVMTTTNGTRALRACAHAQAVLPAAFLNLAATVAQVETIGPRKLLVICSGTHEEASFEDTLGAGALLDRVWDSCRQARIADSAQIAREIYLRHKLNLLAAMPLARNGRRVLHIPELASDVAFCLQLDRFNLAAQLCHGKEVRTVG